MTLPGVGRLISEVIGGALEGVDGKQVRLYLAWQASLSQRQLEAVGAGPQQTLAVGLGLAQGVVPALGIRTGRGMRSTAPTVVAVGLVRSLASGPAAPLGDGQG